jgi:hypothetical protein
MRDDILEKKNLILQWIEEGKTKGFMCSELKCKPETLNSYLEKMGIEYAGRPGAHQDTGYKTAIEYINSGSVVKSHILKGKLIRDGIKKKECELCGVSVWQGEELPLELHHKDGNHYNNDLDNLAILCPNCHSIQEGNSGANINGYKEKAEPKYFCCDCGTVISKGATRCKSCAAKATQKNKTNKPSRAELKFLIRTVPFVQIGRMFGVSDNAVRKWCDSYGLPKKVTDIKNITEEEWFKI